MQASDFSTPRLQCAGVFFFPEGNDGSGTEWREAEVGVVLLTMDLGNTKVAIGAYDGERRLAEWRVTTDVHRTPDELGLLLVQLLEHRGLSPGQVEGTVVASVVPPALDLWREALERYLDRPVWVVTPDLDLGLKIGYHRPYELGADRLVSAFAAAERVGVPAIVVDFGTATTFDVVSRNREYLGGAILPGAQVALDALIERTAQLPKVGWSRPRRVIGQSTTEAIQAGIYFGTIGQVKEITRRIRAELGDEARVVATGGLAPIIGPEVEEVDLIEPHLLLDGLAAIHRRLKRLAVW